MSTCRRAPGPGAVGARRTWPGPFADGPVILQHLRCRLPVVLLLAAACAVGGEEHAGAGLTYYLSADPASLDPALSSDVQSGEMIALLFDNLVEFDPDGRLEPGLATRWESDRSGTVYTFHLRSDARFHDGRPVDARAVRASILRALAPGSHTARQWPLFPIEGARAYAAGTARTVPGIAVPDDSTIRFTLTGPLNIFPTLLAMPVTAV